MEEGGTLILWPMKNNHLEIILMGLYSIAKENIGSQGASLTDLILRHAVD